MTRLASWLARFIDVAGKKYTFGATALLVLLVGLAVSVAFPSAAALYASFATAVVACYGVQAGADAAITRAFAKQGDADDGGKQ